MGSAPSIRDVDRRVDDLRTTLDRMRDNLTELDADLTRRTLESSTTLRGRTAEAWAQSRGALPELWRSLLALDGVVAELTERRGRRPGVSRPVLAKLTELLDGPSVPVPAPSTDEGRPPLTEAPDPVVHRCVDEVVATMSEGFARLAAVVDGVYRVWSTVVPALDALADELDGAGGVPGPGDGVRSESVLLARSLVDDLRDLAATDPLGLPTDAVASARAAVEGVRAERAEAAVRAAALDGVLQTLGASLTSLRASLETAPTGGARSARIAPDADAGPGAAALRGEVDELAQDLLAVRMMAASRPVDASRRAETLQRRIDVLTSAVTALDGAEARGVAERDELRGRLDALQAKAHALGLAEDPELERIRSRATDELYSAPCDLGRSRDLIDEYQRALRETGGGR